MRPSIEAFLQFYRAIKSVTKGKIEYTIPADQVRRIGNGSLDDGQKKLAEIVQLMNATRDHR